jgi:hypothetical protein
MRREQVREQADCSLVGPFQIPLTVHHHGWKGFVLREHRVERTIDEDEARAAQRFDRVQRREAGR